VAHLLSYSAYDGRHNLPSDFDDYINIDFTMSGGNITTWNIQECPSCLGDDETTGSFTSSSVSGDQVGFSIWDTPNCGLFYPGGNGDCSFDWAEYATVSSPGSWSVVYTEPEPSTVILLVVGLIGLLLAQAALPQSMK
jgi:hypothetical protein